MCKKGGGGSVRIVYQNPGPLYLDLFNLALSVRYALNCYIIETYSTLMYRITILQIKGGGGVRSRQYFIQQLYKSLFVKRKETDRPVKRYIKKTYQLFWTKPFQRSLITFAYLNNMNSIDMSLHIVWAVKVFVAVLTLAQVSKIYRSLPKNSQVE